MAKKGRPTTCPVCHGSKIVIDKKTNKPRPCVACLVLPTSEITIGPRKGEKRRKPERRSKLKDRIKNCIAIYQQKYLQTRNLMDLLPMRMVDVAQMVGCDTARISTATRDMELAGIQVKKMFGWKIGDHHVQVVMKMVNEIIQNEVKPMSDSDISKLLNNRGIPISRRSVSKYRLQLGLPPSNQRQILYMLSLTQSI